MFLKFKDLFEKKIILRTSQDRTTWACWLWAANSMA